MSQVITSSFLIVSEIGVLLITSKSDNLEIGVPIGVPSFHCLIYTSYIIYIEYVFFLLVVGRGNDQCLHIFYPYNLE
jgi:hypothetical protein